MDTLKSNDITGMRSGKLVAIERTEERRRGSVLWRCRCDCGKEILLESYKITGGITKSCGCARKGHGIKDLTGQRFGRLTAIERLDEKKGRCYLWRCRCDCGNEVKVPSNGLLSGKTKSCGCGRTDALKSRAMDISGQQFGRLTALRPLEKRIQGSVMWECECECGNVVELSYNSLVTGNTKSCGCLKSEHERPPVHYIDGTCVELVLSDRVRSDNTSGCTGVYWRRNKWTASIQYKGVVYPLGSYEKKEDAIRARKEAEAWVKDDAAQLLMESSQPDEKRPEEMQHKYTGESQQYLI